MEVTDDGTGPRADPRHHQVEQAPRMSKRAAPLKSADKSCSPRDVAGSPSAGWPLKCKLDCFDWGKPVIDSLPTMIDMTRKAADAAVALNP